MVAAPRWRRAISDGYTFLKAVRERDGARSPELDLATPSSTVDQHPRPSTGETALHIWCAPATKPGSPSCSAAAPGPTCQNNEGNTPLILAARSAGSTAPTMLLARAPRSISAISSGETPLIVAVQHARHPDGAPAAEPGCQSRPDRQSLGNSALDYARQDPRAAPILRELGDSTLSDAAA